MEGSERVEAVTDEETEHLITEMEALPSYQGWSFTCEYPGLFYYSHPDLPYTVFFTPDWEVDGELPIAVQDREGACYAEHSTCLALPREGRSGAQLLELVRPTLDKLLTLPRTA